MDDIVSWLTLFMSLILKLQRALVRATKKNVILQLAFITPISSWTRVVFCSTGEETGIGQDRQEYPTHGGRRLVDTRGKKPNFEFLTLECRDINLTEDPSVVQLWLQSGFREILLIRLLQVNSIISQFSSFLIIICHCLSHSPSLFLPLRSKLSLFTATRDSSH